MRYSVLQTQAWKNDDTGKEGERTFVCYYGFTHHYPDVLTYQMLDCPLSLLIAKETRANNERQQGNWEDRKK